jgi:hypothetical protein
MLGAQEPRPSRRGFLKINLIAPDDDCVFREPPPSKLRGILRDFYEIVEERTQVKGQHRDSTLS